MLPIPTRTAVAVFFAVLVCLVVGALAGSLAATVIGATGMIGLAAALAATMPVGRRVRRQRLEFAWWLGHGDPGAGGGAVVPGAPFDVRCFMRHRGLEPLLLASLEPIVPGGATRVDDEADSLALAASARTEFTFRFVAPAVGRVVLHGLAVTLHGPLGLFAVPLYFPNPLVIKVLPQAAARMPTQARVMPGLPVERSGAALLAPHGGGTELRELREMRPGDPFKSIAWKPSARRGKLLVREVDQEVQETRYVVLDASGTMRGGEPGRRKLDHAIEAVAAEARRTLASGDRFGVITVDGRVLAHVAPRDGAAHVLRVFDALLAATEVVDQDLTDVDDDEVCAIVGRYVRQQDGVDFSVAPSGRPGSGAWNVSLLVRHVGKALAAEEAKEEPVVASSPATAMLRRFCRVRGIPLPYRPDPRDGSKGPGLAASLRELVQKSFGPMSITVITDLDGLGDPAPLVAAVKLLRLHGHEVTFVVPDGPSFTSAPRTPLEKDLVEVYARGERRRADEMRALLAPMGVALTIAAASDAPAMLLWKATNRRGGRARVAVGA
ncbi:DUF58 domain-containing protein [Sandaracinus amylolyticus]|uniref:DUF58 domain-containing protein n=1 Tax=Sandaracinus amylolyticus TaxID=927083 RepID=UPI001F29F5CB|nr:DUF58 domain-containing protein [Sandaracinus amylolyticus]UJR79031.1 DUF58 domain-containing protein [Sandaracinus amylolyticus]